MISRPGSDAIEEGQKLRLLDRWRASRTGGCPPARCAHALYAVEERVEASGAVDQRRLLALVLVRG